MMHHESNNCQGLIIGVYIERNIMGVKTQGVLCKQVFNDWSSDLIMASFPGSRAWAQSLGTRLVLIASSGMYHDSMRVCANF